jgi:hypothetical protein
LEDKERQGHWRTRKGWDIVDEEELGHWMIKKGWGIGG